MLSKTFPHVLQRYSFRAEGDRCGFEAVAIAMYMNTYVIDDYWKSILMQTMLSYC
jgi:hypothetical protein